MTGASGRGLSAGFSGSDATGAGCLARVGAGGGVDFGVGVGAAVGGGAVVVCGSVGGAVEGLASGGGGVETEGGLAFTMLRWHPAAPNVSAESANASSRELNVFVRANVARRFVPRFMFMRFMRGAPGCGCALQRAQRRCRLRA